MLELIDAIIKTRETVADIFVKSLVNLEGNSEVEIVKKILTEIKNHNEIFPEGWYSPPPAGVAVLLDQKPFERLKYDSLRNPDFWPKENLRLEKETVGLIFFSPIDRKTNMIGDIGFTLYRGNNEEIKQHLRKAYKNILEVAKHAEVGMRFSDLCMFAINLFQDKFKITRWASISSDPNVSINIGHSVPGSFENNPTFGNTFEKIKESIRTKRVHLIGTENFYIPKTCAFTVESRLENFDNPNLPSTYFHFIVCFDNGKKTILENYSEIFKTVGMDYMNVK
ncbi:hypothetical protein A3A95_03815 [Candidatus Nomurabacteria bacterium RIFCSPLOWO2_01_FULL_39_18]|uniref:Peptidase M24 domain-containing protein n=1 Tax=Candidatus Nomurabacteria bacterium RIFCSPHIGHO2_01_FULL_40_24b TaxID=1801739 RepID=A0A1F6V6G9_9BACT|nr:MAG: hypothetical protein A2647_04705 [Candidatus Nomurabacteria bacterium RIFCSPHIGHO2_01_FULL_40_24b]OGI89233.1 MAG: hypothetical protein A3A95_03815 [Candidatus Nomurabacteria bacterium RIFCSPLOWO2_01_FULL_39_18]